MPSPPRVNPSDRSCPADCRAPRLHSATGRAPVGDDLADRMRRLGVYEDDLAESFVRSGGPGGQNVNKTATCVVLLHRPSGVQVRCQETRHQGRNRLLARERLLAKLESHRAEAARAQRTEQERLKRQKRGRSHAAKQRMLRDKARRSARKADRRPVAAD